MNKKVLRSFIRECKTKHTKEELARLSQETSQLLRCHHRVKEAQTILLYNALPDEVDTKMLLSELYLQGKTLLLPKVISDTDMTIHRYNGEEYLSKGRFFGIMEPDNTPFSDYSSIDLMIIPGMAFDKRGNRLGRGRGYYDRFLSQMPSNVYKIGVCFPFQIVSMVPSDSHDVMMDEVVYSHNN